MRLRGVLGVGLGWHNEEGKRVVRKEQVWMKIMQNLVSLQQAIFDSLRSLPSKQQQTVLDFVEFLKDRLIPTRRLPKSLKGLWSNLDIDPLTETDFLEARREMWSGFGEEIEL